jgi:hypothetical protein
MQALAKHDIGGQQIASSRSLPDTQWLDPGFVRSEITGRGARRTNGPPAPGTHGHGLLGVKVGAVQLQPSPGVTHVAAGASPAFTVDFQNQGQNDEFDVGVRVVISGAGQPIRLQKRVDQTKAGQQVEVTVPLGTAPPIGTPVRVQVTILPVPGELKTDNNTQTYTVIFTR